MNWRNLHDMTYTVKDILFTPLKLKTLNCNES